MAFCRNCGTQLNDGDNFCPKCGKVVYEVSFDSKQESDSKQGSDSEQEETMKLWKKIFYFLVGPVGILAGFFYIFTMRRSMAKSAFFCGIIGTVILLFAAPEINKYFSFNEPEHTAKQILIDRFRDDKGVPLDITDFSLIHKVGNEYTGIVKCIINGKAAEFYVDVVYDGSKVLVEWKWPDICDDIDDKDN